MRKRIIFTLFLIILAIASFYGYTNYQEKVQAEKLSETKRQEKYSKDLAAAIVHIEEGFNISERLVNGYSSTWSDAIYGGDRDFNTAIKHMVNRNKELGKMKVVEELDNKIKEKLKVTNNYPASHEKLYLKVSELYEKYSMMKNYAMEPAGSLIHFNENTNITAMAYQTILDELDTLKTKELQQNIDSYSEDLSSEFLKKRQVISKNPKPDSPSGYDWFRLSIEERGEAVRREMETLEKEGYTFPSYITYPFIMTSLDAFYGNESDLKIHRIHGMTVREIIIEIIGKY